MSDCVARTRSGGALPGPLYEGGPGVKRVVFDWDLLRWLVLSLAHLSMHRLGVISWLSRSVAQFVRAVRRQGRGAPAGVKGWLLVSMCQLASASRRASRLRRFWCRAFCRGRLAFVADRRVGRVAAAAVWAASTYAQRR